MDIFEELLRDPADGNVEDIDLVPFDEADENREGSIEAFELKFEGRGAEGDQVFPPWATMWRSAVYLFTKASSSSLVARFWSIFASFRASRISL